MRREFPRLDGVINMMIVSSQSTAYQDWLFSQPKCDGPTQRSCGGFPGSLDPTHGSQKSKYKQDFFPQVLVAVTGVVAVGFD